MIEFGYHVTAGTVLVIDSIQSPNFIAGSSGWIIRQDGTVEFANATIRGVFEADGANGSFVRVTTTGGTGFGTAVIYLRPPNLPGIAGSEITPGTVTVLSNQPGGAGFVPTSYLQMELDAPSWTFGSTAVDLRYPAWVLRTASHDGTIHPLAVLTTGGAAGNPKTFDITLDGKVVVNGGFDGNPQCYITQAPAISQASAATPTLLTGLNDIDDRFGMLNSGGAGDTVTVPTTGIYEIGMLGEWQAQAVVAGWRGLQVAVNGTTSRRFKLPTSATVNAQILNANLIYRIPLFANDQITFLAGNNSGVALNFTADIWVELKRPT
jgi:hypothetical protein